MLTEQQWEIIVHKEIFISMSLSPQYGNETCYVTYNMSELIILQDYTHS